MSRTPIRSILVAGDGIVGLSAALAFSRALPWVEIRLLRLPADPAAMADHFPATLPSVGRFHAAIGFDEIDLVRRDIAVHHLGTRFTSEAGGEWTHSFGEVGRGEGTVPFHQIWRAVDRAGNAGRFGSYAPASVIAEAGKFVHPSGDSQSPLADYVYGLRINPMRYRALLEQATERLTRIDGPIMGVERREDGGIKRLELGGGQAAEADLYVDCGGPSGTLIGGAIEPWGEWLPARHIAAQWRDSKTLEPIDRVTAIRQGWRLTATVPGASLEASVTTRPTPTAIQINPGRRRETFVGNVVAIGDSAIALDPLSGANLTLAHHAILRAIDLLPGRDCNPLERAEFGRLTALEASRARDFQILLQRHLTSPIPLPASLERTLTQWRSRGRLPFFEEELLTPSSWMQMLIGTGNLPDSVAPTARSIDPSVAADAMARLASELQAIAASLPAYPDYLARMKQQR